MLGGSKRTLHVATSSCAAAPSVMGMATVDGPAQGSIEVGGATIGATAQAAGAPPPLEGVVWKKSPKMLASVYQKRNFSVADGKIRYESGKGEVQTVEVADILSVSATDTERLEFSFKVKQGREYAFRVETSSQFSYWVRGLQRHVEWYGGK